MFEVEKNMINTPILISGAGPVGLSLSLALCRQGIENIVVEKHASTSIHPKARGTNVRSMEFFRQWQAEQRIRRNELVASARRWLWMESVYGEIVGDVKVGPTKSLSPTEQCFIAQDKLEEALVDILSHYPESEIFFSTELTDFSQTENGVICTLYNKNNASYEKIHCQYLIGADGARSFVRKQLGIRMQGVESLGENVSVYCEADLRPWLHDKPFAVAMFTNKEQRGRFMMAVDLKTKWVVGQNAEPGATPLTQEQAVQLVRDTVAEPTLKVDVINISKWQMAALNASQYYKNNVFLCGDAAHRIPPTGGMGMNTGLGDAHNLGWKLAYVIKGYADKTLLESYAAERKPIAEYTINWSTENAIRLRAMHVAIANEDMTEFKKLLSTQKEHINHPGLDLGYIYRSMAIFNHADECSTFSASEYQPEVRTGMRFPHCEIKINNRHYSILDLFEKNYVLFVNSNSNNRQDYSLPIPDSYPLTIYRLGQDIVGKEGDFEKLLHLQKNQFVLVRPDGHVCYKTKSV